MLDEISTMSTINLSVVSGTVIVLAVLLFILIRKRGAKASINGKTVEIPGEDGEVHYGNANSLMYVMNDTCTQIQQRKKERIDSIIPELSELFETISTLSCLELKVESLLHGFRRKNGFDKLTSERTINDYIDRVEDTIIRGLKREALKVTPCTAAQVAIDEDAVRPIAQAFTVQAIRECVEEYREKQKMYDQYKPLFATLGDAGMVEFCQSKSAKHAERIESLTSVLDRVIG